MIRLFIIYDLPSAPMIGFAPHFLNPGRSVSYCLSLPSISERCKQGPVRAGPGCAEGASRGSKGSHAAEERVKTMLGLCRLTLLSCFRPTCSWQYVPSSLLQLPARAFQQRGRPTQRTNCWDVTGPAKEGDQQEPCSQPQPAQHGRPQEEQRHDPLLTCGSTPMDWWEKGRMGCAWVKAEGSGLWCGSGLTVVQPKVTESRHRFR